MNGWLTQKYFPSICHPSCFPPPSTWLSQRGPHSGLKDKKGLISVPQIVPNEVIFKSPLDFVHQRYFTGNLTKACRIHFIKERSWKGHKNAASLTRRKRKVYSKILRLKALVRVKPLWPLCLPKWKARFSSSSLIPEFVKHDWWHSFC